MCDEHTIVCLPADCNATAATATRDRLNAALANVEAPFHVAIIELPNDEGSLAALFSRADFAFNSKIAS